MKRFTVHPGYVTSPNDGDIHWVSAHQLMRLYRVQPHECIIVDRNNPNWNRGLTPEYLDTLLHLRPYNNWYIPVSELERDQYPLGLND